MKTNTAHSEDVLFLRETEHRETKNFPGHQQKIGRSLNSDRVLHRRKRGYDSMN